MPDRVTLTLSIPKWVPAVGAAVVVVLGAVVLVLGWPGRWSSTNHVPSVATTTTSGASGAGRGGLAGIGGDLNVAFVSTATAAQRRAALSTCGTLPGVTGWSVEPGGYGSMTVPPAEEIGGNPAVIATHQRERQRILACLKSSPFVAATTEGL